MACSSCGKKRLARPGSNNSASRVATVTRSATPVEAARVFQSASRTTAAPTVGKVPPRRTV